VLAGTLGQENENLVRRFPAPIFLPGELQKPGFSEKPGFFTRPPVSYFLPRTKD